MFNQHFQSAAWIANHLTGKPIATENTDYHKSSALQGCQQDTTENLDVTFQDWTSEASRREKRGY